MVILKENKLHEHRFLEVYVKCLGKFDGFCVMLWKIVNKLLTKLVLAKRVTLRLLYTGCVGLKGRLGVWLSIEEVQFAARAYGIATSVDKDRMIPHLV